MPSPTLHRAVLVLALGLGLASFLGCAGLRPPLPAEVPLRLWTAPAGALSAGAAAVEITPRGSVYMAGFSVARRSQGVADPLYARAVVLESADLRLGLVAVDLVGIQREDRLALDARLDAAGFDPRLVWLAATHNHAGPDTLGFWGIPPFLSGRDPAWMAELFDAIVAALVEARGALRPAEITATTVRLDPEGLFENLRRPGLVDPDLGVVHLRGAGGGPDIASLLVLGCHPEVWPRENRQLSADFPGVSVARVEAARGGVALFAAGSVGGLVAPSLDPAADPADERVRIGGAVADAALAALDGPLAYERRPRVAAAHSTLHLPLRNWRYDLATRLGLLPRTLYRGDWIETEVNRWAIGPLRLLSVPGEITPDLGLRARDDAGGRPSLLLGLVNDELGYLLPESDFDQALFGYERGFSPGAEAGERVVERLRELRLRMEGPAGSPVGP